MSYQPIVYTASATLGPADANAPIVVNAAAGLTLTLPAAAGTGRTFEIIIGTTVTSNSVIVKVANASDTMAGVCYVAQDAGDAVVAFEAGATADTITLNGTTTGGIKGDRIVLKSAATNLWYVQMTTSATGTESTPFSATVS